MKKLLSGGLLAASLVLFAAGGASAAPATVPAASPQVPDTPLDCEFQIGMDFSSPLGGRVWSESGTFNCTDKRIKGHRITGPGRYSLVGDYTGACAAGIIEGNYEMVVPTGRGPLLLTDEFSIEWGPFGGHLSQQMGNKSFDGAFGGVPTTGGPCVGGRADVIGAGVLR